MTTMQELLERTSLKSIGTFLLNDGLLWNLDEDMPADVLITAKRDNFRIALSKAGVPERQEITQALHELEDAAESVGFYAGLKAGARLVLSLTSDSELIC